MDFYTFGLDNSLAKGSTELLGGKGAGLVWLANEGVPVPPGFVIPTTVWADYDKKPKTTMKEIAKALPEYLAKLEAHFGYMPLLSVRSGARVSCPGMMDTILNVGLDSSNIPGWIEKLGPKCFGNSFERLVAMYGSVVAGIRKESLEGNLKSRLDAYQEHTGSEFPNAKDQLLKSIEAVFKSWDTDRAIFYRKEHGYDREWGTAVTVQAMVFGNLNDQSGAGVLFSRNPMTGAMAVTGEWLPNAQGEDVVDGSKTPLSLDKMKEWNAAVHDELVNHAINLENLKREMLDIEFTIQDGKLYLLQVRTGKRSPLAAIKIAVDMVKQGLVEPKVAIKRVSPKEFDLAQTVTVDPKFTKPAAFTGLGASNGVATGKPVFSKEDAIACKEPCILVTHETTPSDIAGMKAAKGVITMVGGMTCHAAIVVRPMGKACIVGVGQSIESFKDVEVISMDGLTGRIWTEVVPTVGGKVNGEVREFSKLVRETLGIIPVVFDVPVEPMDEALLYLGDKVLSDDAMGIVTKTLNMVNKLYLDLVPSAEEERFMNIVSAHGYTQRLLSWVEGLPAAKLAKLVVIAKPELATSLQRIEFSSDLRSLVLSGADIVMGGGLDIADPAVKRVLDWKKAEGGAIVSIGQYLDGSKSMISVPQALQLIGNGVVQ